MRNYILILLTAIPLLGHSQKKSQVIVEVNPEIELFTIAAYLSGNIQFVIPSNYEVAVKKELKSFRKHPAVSEIKKLYQGKNFSIETVHPMLGYRCSPLPELKVVYPSEIFDKDALENYLKYFRNFSDEINFRDFYADHKPAMDTWIKPVQDTIAKYQLADKLGDFFGIHKAFRIHLSAFNSWGGQAFVPNAAFAETKAYFILGYNSYTDDSGKDKPPFFNNRAMLIDLVWHEGGHTYINPRVDQNLQLFEESRPLLNEERQAALQKAGRFTWDWDYFLREQVTRATVAYLLRKNMSESAWQKECLRQEQIGFIYTKDISQLLSIYDNNKAKYSDFADFLPAIAAYLKIQVPKK